MNDKYNIKNVETILTSDEMVIEELNNNGIEFLTYCIKSKEIYQKNKIIIDNYHELYTEGTLFENMLESYINNISIDTYLWDNYCTTFTSNIPTMLEKIKTHIFKTKNVKLICDTYNNIIGGGKNKIINNNVLNFSKTKSEMLKLCDFIDVIENMENDNEWKYDIICVSNMIAKLLRYPWYKTKIIGYIIDIINNNIERKEIKGPVTNPSLLSDKFMFNMTAILYNIMVIMSNDNWINMIQLSYIYEKNCGIRWQQKNNEKSNIKYNMITKIFYMLARLINISYDSILTYKKILDDYEEYLRSPMMRIFMYSDIEICNKLDLVIYARKTNNILISNNIMKEWMSEYYKSITEYIDKSEKNETVYDDILEGFIKFSDNDKKYLTSKMGTFICDCIANKSKVANPSIRLRCVKLCMDLLDNNILLDKKILMNKIIMLHNDLTNYKRTMDDDFIDRNILYKNCIKLCKMEDSEGIFDMINYNDIKEFTRIIFSDFGKITNCYEEAENILMTDVNRRKQGIKYLMFLMNYMWKILLMIDSLLKQSDKFVEVLSEESCLVLIHPINFIINKFSKIPEYCLEDNETPYKIIEMLVIIVLLYGKTYEKNKETCNIIVKTHPNINPENMQLVMEKINNTTCKIIKSDKMMNNIKHITDFINNCIIIIKQREENSNIDYPDEFLDAITGTPIEDPVWIPGTTLDTIIDRSTINKWFGGSNVCKNPYTGKELTLEEFIEYNNNENINKERIKFKNELNEWVKNNIL